MMLVIGKGGRKESNGRLPQAEVRQAVALSFHINSLQKIHNSPGEGEGSGGRVPQSNHSLGEVHFPGWRIELCLYD